jgi:hypothetical protein
VAIDGPRPMSSATETGYRRTDPLAAHSILDVTLQRAAEQLVAGHV